MPSLILCLLTRYEPLSTWPWHRLSSPRLSRCKLCRPQRSHQVRLPRVTKRCPELLSLVMLVAAEWTVVAASETSPSRLLGVLPLSAGCSPPSSFAPAAIISSQVYADWCGEASRTPMLRRMRSCIGPLHTLLLMVCTLLRPTLRPHVLQTQCSARTHSSCFGFALVCTWF